MGRPAHAGKEPPTLIVFRRVRYEDATLRTRRALREVRAALASTPWTSRWPTA